MGMTREEKLAKKEIFYILLDGFADTYAPIFRKLDLNITDDPGTVAYFEPAKGRIVVNRGLDEDQLCVIIRHEILHYYLEHEIRLVNKISKERGIDSADDISLRDIKREIYSNKDFNIAGDYEISNLSYDERDKNQVRSIKLNGQILTGLVTEDDHPDWVNLSLEEMYDKLRDIRRKELEKAKKELENMKTVDGSISDPFTFIGEDGIVYGI